MQIETEVLRFKFGALALRFRFPKSKRTASATHTHTRMNLLLMHTEERRITNQSVSFNRMRQAIATHVHPPTNTPTNTPRPTPTHRLTTKQIGHCIRL